MEDNIFVVDSDRIGAAVDGLPKGKPDHFWISEREASIQIPPTPVIELPDLVIELPDCDGYRD